MIEYVILTLVGVALIFGVGLLIFEKRLYSIIDSFADLIKGAFTEPTVKKAFAILGGKSADAKANRAVVDSLATDILSGPKFASLKMGASFLGIDIDSYIEEHGALNTLEGLQSIAGALGINVNDIIAGGIGGSVQPSEVKNPYL